MLWRADPAADAPPPLLPRHRAHLRASGITDAVIEARGYYSETDAAALRALGFSPAQCRVPALVLPLFSTGGSNGGVQIKPDRPRVVTRDGDPRPIKYETPIGSRLGVDVHSRTLTVLGDPGVDLLISEGVKKGDSALSHGWHCLNLSGVYGWRGTNRYGGKCTLSDFDDIALPGRQITIVFDSDGATNPQVQAAGRRLQAMLARRDAQPLLVFLPPAPDGGKQGLDDFLVAGGELAALIADAKARPSGVLVAERRRFHLTDLGNAERFVERHRDEVRYGYERRRWYCFIGSHWSPDAEDVVARLAQQTVRSLYADAATAADDAEVKAILEHARRSEAAPRIDALLTLARSQRGLRVRPDDLDRDPYLLNCANGTLDLRTGELRPFQRAELITRVLTVPYDPDATCPTWDRFLREITLDRSEMIGFLQKAFGYSLTADTSEQAIFIGHGGGKNGKTVLYRVVNHLLGGYAAHIRSETLEVMRNSDGPRNDVAALAGVRLATCSETEDGRRFAESLLKQLTGGGDPITARFLYGEFFSFVPTAKIWLMTNHKPVIKGTDNAIWDRIRLIPFDYRVPHERQDKQLIDKLLGEAPGILAWAVRGCLAWQRDGLGEPDAVRAATAIYRAESDVLGAFIDECCVVGDRVHATAKDLYDAYSAWATAVGERPMSQISLGKRLEERGLVPIRLGSARKRAWKGIGLRDENPPPSGSEPLDSDDGAVPPRADIDVSRRESTAPATSEDACGRADAFSARTHMDAIFQEVQLDSPRERTFPENASTGVHPTKCVRIRSDAEFAAILPELLAADALGLDVETTGLNPRSDRLCLLQLATHERVYLIDAAAVDLRPLVLVFALPPGDGPLLIGHNLGFDLAFLQAAGLPIPAGTRLFDTLLASQLLDGGVHLATKVPDPAGRLERGKPVQVGYHSLAALAHRTLGVILDKTAQASDWTGPLSDEQLAYAAQDAAIPLLLRDALAPALAEAGLTQTAALEFGALPAIIWMEAAGAPLDVAAWAALRDAAAEELAALDAELATLLPGVNLDARAQLIRALAERGVTLPNAQEATLAAVRDRDPAITLVLRRKQAKKRVSTYGDGYLQHVDPTTGRIHAGYRLIGAASGRMACRAPNLQNIPRDPAYRRCIRPPAGRVFVKADYSQIELRIAACLSGDAALLDAFRQGDDLHLRTARAVLGREPTPQDRQLAKSLNFGLLYGMGVPRFREYAAQEYGVDLSVAAAERLRQRFFAAYPGIAAWHRRQPEEPIDTRTASGRLRRAVARFTEKLNSPVQGTGADVLKRALGRLWADRATVPSAVPILAVHDELVFEVDVDAAEDAKAWLREHMVAAGTELVADVPIVVEAAIVADWSGTAIRTRPARDAGGA